MRYIPRAYVNTNTTEFFICKYDKIEDQLLNNIRIDIMTSIRPKCAKCVGVEPILSQSIRIQQEKINYV